MRRRLVTYLTVCWAKYPYKTENVTSEGVRTTFYDIQHSKLELLKDTQEEHGVIHKFIEKRGEGMHHLPWK